MEKIKLKVHGYEESSGSIIVSFAPENSTKPIDEYQRFAYQPAKFPGLSPAEVIKQIARSGVHIIDQVVQEEAFRESSEVEVYKGLAGSEFDFDINELIETAPQTVEVRTVSENVLLEDKFMNEIISE